MSTIKDKCKDCWVESVDENSVCYAGKHRIVYCSLHNAAILMQETLKRIKELYGNEDARKLAKEAITASEGEINDKDSETTH